MKHFLSILKVPISQKKSDQGPKTLQLLEIQRKTKKEKNEVKKDQEVDHSLKTKDFDRRSVLLLGILPASLVTLVLAGLIDSPVTLILATIYALGLYFSLFEVDGGL